MPSKELEKYLSNYRGIDDPHLTALRIIKKKCNLKRVLYPESWIHLTPSLVFPYVVYVDFYNNSFPNEKSLQKTNSGSLEETFVSKSNFLFRVNYT